MNIYLSLILKQIEFLYLHNNYLVKLMYFMLGTRNDLRAIMDRIEKSLNAYFIQTNRDEPEHIVNGNCSLKPDH